jgi:hypothetical protein
MVRSDSSGPLGKGEAASAFGSKAPPNDYAAVWVARRFQAPLAFAASMSTAINQASQSDRAWLALHRNRAYWRRPAIAGEFPKATFPTGATHLALVKQALPGARIQLALWATQLVCACEECLTGIWGHLAPPRFRKLSVDIAAIVLRVGQ